MSEVHVVAIITNPINAVMFLRLLTPTFPTFTLKTVVSSTTADTQGVGGIQTEIGPNAFIVIEKESLDHLKAHAAAPIWRSTRRR